eukprot:1258488-Amorphochlora_amoeboformis.AAC.1
MAMDACGRKGGISRRRSHFPRDTPLQVCIYRFEVTGYFINGKNIGPGIFKAPNGDTFYGKWNDDFKREGYHMKVTPSGKLQLHSFQDGKLKRDRIHNSDRTTQTVGEQDPLAYA